MADNEPAGDEPIAGVDKEMRPIAKVSARTRQIVLAVCALLLIALWTMQQTPYLNVADDSGRYMVLGESLARTGDLRLINNIHRPLDTLYPPGFPTVIAFWIRVTGREPGDVVSLVKLTNLFLLLLTLPMLLTLLQRAQIPPRLVPLLMLVYAGSPALASYANEVMSEVLLLFLCLASIVLIDVSSTFKADLKRRESSSESDQGSEEPDLSGKQNNERRNVVARRVLALACAAGAFLTRTSGLALLFALTVWFWRRYGWRWGALAAAVLLLCVGGWLGRNRQIVKTHPTVHYANYLDQFWLRDPSKLGAGRIQHNPLGIASRIKSGVPTYIGMIPRAVLHMMSPGSVWNALFFVVAVPLTLLILYGVVIGIRRGLSLWAYFAMLFWFLAAIWPWQNARFLVPLIPLMIVFLGLGVEAAGGWLAGRIGGKRQHGVMGAAFLLLFVYYARVHYRVITQEGRPTVAGYTLGRTPAEGGFYAACDWLKKNAEPNRVVMGKPQYLLHLYSGCPTTQIEPNGNPGNQERGYIAPQRVGYLVEDAWKFGFTTKKLLAPYLAMYRDRWELVWQDPNGSGVRIWKRRDEFLKPE